MKLENNKGFTLIELLIVITIIGILAVAFLPTLLGAGSRGNDTQRQADLRKLQNVLVSRDLTGQPLPAADGCVDAVISATVYGPDFGGVIPSDPQADNTVSGCTGDYYYDVDPDGNGTYRFGLYAGVENADLGNTTCAKALTGEISDAGENNDCYAIFTQ